MKILISSHAFLPSVGGIETVTRLLSSEFLKLGHEVRIATQTPGSCVDSEGISVSRRPSRRDLWEAVRWCDVFWHNNVSLRTAWPLLGIRRPWVVTTQTWLDHGGARTACWKRFALRFALNIAISRPVSETLPGTAQIIGNPFDHVQFRKKPEIARDGNLAFVGRLVSDKGVDLLLDALEILLQSDVTPQLVIIGEGPERSALEGKVAAANLRASVRFAGALRGSSLADELNRHRILVIPSRWAEPFGIVALEGLACGCVPIVSAGGGLPEAIGLCGATFPNGDARALADVLAQWVNGRARQEEALRNAEEHLRQFQADRVAAKYLAVFEEALGRAARA